MSIQLIQNNPDALDDKSVNLYANTITVKEFDVSGDIEVSGDPPILTLKDSTNSGNLSEQVITLVDKNSQEVGSLRYDTAEIKLKNNIAGGKASLVSNAMTLSLDDTTSLVESNSNFRISDISPVVQLKDSDTTTGTSTGAIQWYDSTTTLTNQISKAGPQMFVASLDTGSSVHLLGDTTEVVVNSDGMGFPADQIRIGVASARTGANVPVIAIGNGAGQNDQQSNAIAIGPNAGNATQSGFGIAVGLNAGKDTQGAGSVAIGSGAGESTQGDWCVAIGAGAQNSGGHDDCITLNGGGTNLPTIGVGRFMVDPIRGVAHGLGVGVMHWDSGTKEVTYSTN